MAPRKAKADAATSGKGSANATAPSKQAIDSKVTKAKAPTRKPSTTKTEKKAPTTKAKTAKSNTTKTTTKKSMPNGVASEKPIKKNNSTSSHTTTTTEKAETKIKEKVEKAPSGASKATTAKATAEPAVKKPSTMAQETKKRKSEEEHATGAPVARPVKKARTAAPRVIINEAPTERLNVYVCGEGSSGELGLGAAKNAVDVKRPRLNVLLAADTVGVVQIAVGGMHVAALTHDNRVLTWGVNDQGALGRDTTWGGGMRDIDDSGSESGSESGLNPRECTPDAVSNSYFPEGTKIVELAASDSATYALTDDGFVYGWGTFRSNDGILGFNQDVQIQHTPLLLPELKKITHIVAGANHILALTDKGNVFAWGSGQQNQLGRRVVERTKKNGLVPREFGLPRSKISFVECGSYHSFAIDKAGKVWTWGLNNFGETGVSEGAGEDDAVVLAPAVVKSLNGRGVVQINGGTHHSIAVTKDNECLVWGRMDGHQMGMKLADLPKEDLVFDEKNRPRILKTPTVVPGKPPPPPLLRFYYLVLSKYKLGLKVKYATAGSDASLAITTDGQAYSWGFSANYQTGQGTTEDVEVATLIDNTALRGKKLNWAAAGGQFSVFTAAVDEQKPLVNGN
ncbi:MAG: hypothetical protein M1835_001133 [Candelina submexicana]|nr:MAG: hypothetical protein M1835_001133 [Candelina submexicana]